MCFCHTENLKSAVKIWETFKHESISEGFLWVYTLKWGKKGYSDSKCQISIKIKHSRSNHSDRHLSRNVRTSSRCIRLTKQFDIGPKRWLQHHMPHTASKNVTETANCCCHDVFHLTGFGKSKWQQKFGKWQNIIFVTTEAVNVLLQRWCHVTTCSKSTYNLEGKFFGEKKYADDKDSPHNPGERWNKTEISSWHNHSTANKSKLRWLNGMVT